MVKLQWLALGEESYFQVHILFPPVANHCGYSLQTKYIPLFYVQGARCRKTKVKAKAPLFRKWIISRVTYLLQQRRRYEKRARFLKKSLFLHDNYTLMNILILIMTHRNLLERFVSKLSQSIVNNDTFILNTLRGNADYSNSTKTSVQQLRCNRSHLHMNVVEHILLTKF